MTLSNENIFQRNFLDGLSGCMYYAREYYFKHASTDDLKKTKRKDIMSHTFDFQLILEKISILFPILLEGSVYHNAVKYLSMRSLKASNWQIIILKKEISR